MPMNQTLGIAVTTERHLDHLIGLVKAARAKGKQVLVFFTGRGALLTASPRLTELDGLAEMAVCKVSLQSHGLSTERPIPGIPAKNVTNQDWHAAMIDRADRYISL